MTWRCKSVSGAADTDITEAAVLDLASKLWTLFIRWTTYLELHREKLPSLVVRKSFIICPPWLEFRWCIHFKRGPIQSWKAEKKLFHISGNSGRSLVLVFWGVLMRTFLISWWLFSLISMLIGISGNFLNTSSSRANFLSLPVL